MKIIEGTTNAIFTVIVKTSELMQGKAAFNLLEEAHIPALLATDSDLINVGYVVEQNSQCPKVYELDYFLNKYESLIQKGGARSGYYVAWPFCYADEVM